VFREKLLKTSIRVERASGADSVDKKPVKATGEPADRCAID